MSEIVELVLIVAALALSECVYAVRHGGVSIASSFGRRFAAVFPSSSASFGESGLAFANPLPPFGAYFLVEPLPFSASEDGAYAFVAATLSPRGRPPQTHRFLPWDDVKDVATDGKDVLVGGARFCRAGSDHAARAAAIVLRDVAAAADRAQALDDALDRSFDAAAVRAAADKALVAAAVPRALQTVLFAFLFGVAPYVLLREGFTRWPLLLAGLYVPVVGIAAVFLLAHRRLYPGARYERFVQTALMLPAPTVALRASDKLARHALAFAHPAAAAAVLMAPEQRDAFLARTLRDLRAPLLPLPNDDVRAAAVEESWRRALGARVEAIALGAGVSVKALTAPPALGKGAVAYCPRCSAEYRHADGVCEDCGGVPLVAG